MTTIYFVRHAESDSSVHDGQIRPLTEKGLADRAKVTDFLRDKGIDAVISSPYKRAFDTVADFAQNAGFAIRTIEDFRERRSDTRWDRENDFFSFLKRQWDDFSYTLDDGECLAEVQQRNISALNGVLREYKNKNIVIGTHGTALSTIINYYDNTYGFEDFMAMVNIMPWIVKMIFEGSDCAGLVKIDLFHPAKIPDYEKCGVHTFAAGVLKAYRFVVIFARCQDRWLYCRAKARDTYETAGGHIEQFETPLEAAKRELYEETGALKFDIKPVFDYSVHTPTAFSNGQVFLAQIQELGKMPDFEMAEVRLFDTIPEQMRFPQILPVLFGKIKEMI